MTTRKIKFKYIFNPDYNPQAANGAYGGVCPTGEIIINFFLERHPLPKSITYEAAEDGTLLREIDREPEDQASSVVRFVNTGVVLSLSSAKSLNSWLQEKIASAEELAKKQAEIDKSARGKK